jgi:hypothetical protein
MDFNPLQQSEKECTMNKSSPVSLVALAALLLAGSALAQTVNPSGADADRADRHCISTTLSADPSAPCSDDVLNDRPGESPAAARYAPPKGAAPGAGTQPSPGSTGAIPTGTAVTGTTVNGGTGSTGPSMGTGKPSTGTGAVSAGGTAGAPARR